tara:strand:+ start:5152 stop:5487 length:336 start_codon:yes stop_codon:yes gene_type:complete
MNLQPLYIKELIFKTKRMSKDVIVVGTVKSIGPLFEKGEFKKRDLVLETGGDHSQVLAIEFVKANEEKLDLIEIGEKVSVSCNLRGREWVNPEGNTKYFMSLSAWKLEKIN